MTEVIYWILLSGFFLILFVVFILLGIVKKKIKLIFASLVFVLLFVISSLVAGYKFFFKAFHSVQEITRGRTGDEIYRGLFGSPAGNCLKIENQKDQIVPGLDCCIWLQFKTCPVELQRILHQEPYQFSKAGRLQLKHRYPAMEDAPSWWKPERLGDTVLIYEYHHTKEDRSQYAFVSTDSTRVYYCDLLY